MRVNRMEMDLRIRVDVTPGPLGSDYTDLVSMEVTDDGQVDTDALVEVLSNMNKEDVVEMFITVLSTGLWRAP